MNPSIPRTMCRASCFFPPDLDIVVDAEIVAGIVEEDNMVVEGIPSLDGSGVDKPVEVTALVCRVVVGDLAKSPAWG